MEVSGLAPRPVAGRQSTQVLQLRLDPRLGLRRGYGHSGQDHENRYEFAYPPAVAATAHQEETPVPSPFRIRPVRHKRAIRAGFSVDRITPCSIIVVIDVFYVKNHRNVDDRRGVKHGRSAIP
jgi:hypothetical protein